MHHGKLIAGLRCMRAEMLLDKNVEREILNHRQLVHPNIIAFKEVYTTDTDLAIVVRASMAINLLSIKHTL